MIAKDSTTSVAAAPTPSQPPAATPAATPTSALVVHTESAKLASKPALSDSDAAAPAPSSLGLTSSADPHALAAIGSAPVAVPKASNQVLKISQGVSEGLVLKKVQPRYPSQALQLHMEGSVQLQATIGKDGSISNLKILSGEAMLARAAQDAVKQWKYKPYYLNGEPVEIQTQITVNFKLPN
jgi:protein TonB